MQFVEFCNTHWRDTSSIFKHKWYRMQGVGKLFLELHTNMNRGIYRMKHKYEWWVWCAVPVYVCVCVCIFIHFVELQEARNARIGWWWWWCTRKTGLKKFIELSFLPYAVVCMCVCVVCTENQWRFRFSFSFCGIEIEPLRINDQKFRIFVRNTESFMIKTEQNSIVQLQNCLTNSWHYLPITQHSPPGRPCTCTTRWWRKLSKILR